MSKSGLQEAFEVDFGSILQGSGGIPKIFGEGLGKDFEGFFQSAAPFIFFSFLDYLSAVGLFWIKDDHTESRAGP